MNNANTTQGELLPCIKAFEEWSGQKLNLEMIEKMPHCQAAAEWRNFRRQWLEEAK
jgi:hypothetical protein